MKRAIPALLRALGLLALLAIAVLALLGILQSRDPARQAGSSAPFSYDLYADNQFALQGGGLLVVSPVSIELFDSSGVALQRLSHQLIDPMLAGSGDYAVVWSQSSRDAILLSAGGEAQTVSLPGNVMGADVNRQGWVVFLTEESGNKGAASVYRPNGDAAYRVRLGSSYPLDAALSPDGSRLALLSLQSGGCHVGVYGLQQEKEQFGWTAADTVFVELCYLSDGNLLLLGTDSAVFLNSQCEPLNQFAFTGEYLKDYSYSGEGFFALVLGKFKTGNAARIVTLDTNGQVLAALELSDEVEGLSADGSYLSVLFHDKTILYYSSLQALATLEHTAGIRASLVRADGSAIIVSGNGAAIYEP